MSLPDHRHRFVDVLRLPDRNVHAAIVDRVNEVLLLGRILVRWRPASRRQPGVARVCCARLAERDHSIRDGEDQYPARYVGAARCTGLGLDWSSFMGSTGHPARSTTLGSIRQPRCSCPARRQHSFGGGSLPSPGPFAAPGAAPIAGRSVLPESALTLRIG
jgi:hypothetical protein